MRKAAWISGALIALCVAVLLLECFDEAVIGGRAARGERVVRHQNRHAEGDQDARDPGGASHGSVTSTGLVRGQLA